MDPITIAIISFILTFLAAKKGGMSTTGALLAGAGVAGLSYYGTKKLSENDATEPLDISTGAGTPANLGDKLGDAAGGIVDWVANNPSLAIGGAAVGLGLGSSDKTKQYLLWAGIAVGAFVILK